MSDVDVKKKDVANPVAFFVNGTVRFLTPSALTDRDQTSVESTAIHCNCFEYDKNHLCSHLKDAFTGVAWTNLLNANQMQEIQNRANDFIETHPLIVLSIPVGYASFTDEVNASQLIRMRLTLALCTTGNGNFLSLYLLKANPNGGTEEISDIGEWELIGNLIVGDGLNVIWSMLKEYVEGLRLDCTNKNHPKDVSFLPQTWKEGAGDLDRESTIEENLDATTPGRYRSEQLCLAVTNFCWECTRNALTIVDPEAPRVVHEIDISLGLPYPL